MEPKYYTKERPKFGVSIYDIAKRTGLRPYHVSRILHGKGCTIENAYFVCHAMGITFDEFMRRFYASRIGIAA